ncbi:hypothetical protein SUBVAR_07302 [Subdoligranulum variabile DSM 15176]|uniref:Uncharacterized protein n=1 Tax=Subdoligranulum variabile DSM 15176 TaxID=411471 RepID=D1PSB9_9FIRM|nr:hypothetical protein SUBVAR_07302 [Subdoligranulum variabile DSM 15176]
MPRRSALSLRQRGRPLDAAGCAHRLLTVPSRVRSGPEQPAMK